MSTSAIIRPERVSDYPDIADIHARAFANGISEALIVSLLRHRRYFDPELSLVAELDGRPVGHALFSPHLMRLLDADVRAVNLGPIGILPDHQRRGIGGDLIREGHRIAAAKGYALSFLVGHPTYYPRFGYRTHAYGRTQVRVAVDSLPAPSTLTARAPRPEDVSALWQLWRHDEAAVDFALNPGRELLDWISPNPLIASVVFCLGDQIVGYTRLHQQEPAHPRVFLAADAAAARLVAAEIAQRARIAEIVLPIHPLSRSAAAFTAASLRSLEPAMAMSLGPSPLDEYFALVESGQRPAGRVTWPVTFDL